MSTEAIIPIQGSHGDPWSRRWLLISDETYKAMELKNM